MLNFYLCLKFLSMLKLNITPRLLESYFVKSQKTNGKQKCNSQKGILGQYCNLSSTELSNNSHI